MLEAQHGPERIIRRIYTSLPCYQPSSLREHAVPARSVKGNEDKDAWIPWGLKLQPLTKKPLP